MFLCGPIKDGYKIGKHANLKLLQIVTRVNTIGVSGEIIPATPADNVVGGVVKFSA